MGTVDNQSKLPNPCGRSGAGIQSLSTRQPQNCGHVRWQLLTRIARPLLSESLPSE